MNSLEKYIPPEAGIVYFTACSALCTGDDDSLTRGTATGVSDGYGIELPDDEWNKNS